MTQFYDLLEQEYKSLSSLNESVKLTAAQRKKVTSLGRNGWSVLKQDGDKVVMQKDDKEVFVYSTGKTFFVTESDIEIEVGDLLEEAYSEEILEESLSRLIPSIFKRNKPKIKMYVSGPNIIAVVKKVDGTYSFVHIIDKKVHKESDSITLPEIKEYLGMYPSYKKLTDLGKAFRFAMLGIILGMGIFAGGSVAFMALRGLFFTFGVLVELNRPTKYGIDDEETRKAIVSSLEKSIHSKSGEFELDVDAPVLPGKSDFKISDIISMPNISDSMANLTMVSGAVASTLFFVNKH